MLIHQPYFWISAAIVSGYSIINIIHYGITNDCEEKSEKTKIEFQNTYKKNIVKRWSKILK